MTASVGVIGSGAWGTALAHAQAEAGRPVTLWAREAEVVESISEKSENTVFLPGITLDKNITVTDSLMTVAEQDIILVVTPAQYVRSTLEALRGEGMEDKPIVICSKGIEIESGKML